MHNRDTHIEHDAQILLDLVFDVVLAEHGDLGDARVLGALVPDLLGHLGGVVRGQVQVIAEHARKRFGRD